MQRRWEKDPERRRIDAGEALETVEKRTPSRKRRSEEANEGRREETEREIHRKAVRRRQ